MASTVPGPLEVGLHHHDNTLCLCWLKTLKLYYKTGFAAHICLVACFIKLQSGQHSVQLSAARLYIILTACLNVLN